jgi:hypothetical protein
LGEEDGVEGLLAVGPTAVEKGGRVLGNVAVGGSVLGPRRKDGAGFVVGGKESEEESTEGGRSGDFSLFLGAHAERVEGDGIGTKNRLDVGGAVGILHGIEFLDEVDDEVLPGSGREGLTRLCQN